MKKTVLFISAMCLVLSLTACNENTKEENDANISAGPAATKDLHSNEKEDADVIENDKQHDSQTEPIVNNGLPYGQPVNFDTSGLPDAFVSAIQEFCRTGTFPDGQDNGSIPDSIAYAVYDVDGDGKDELILKNQNNIMAAMTERIYAYENGVFREELSEFPALTYYDNGLIQAEWSHNQGVAGDRLWPYTLYQYQSDSDSYVMLGAVDAWDKKRADSIEAWGAFPDDIDTNRDGYVYFLLPSDWEGQYSRADIVDGSDYENWRNRYLGGAKTLEIPYRELSVKKIFPNAAG